MVDGESGDLGARVNAGVGASRARHVNGLAFHAADDFFENALDGRQARLHLPAVEIGAVVGEGDADAARHAGHRLSTLPSRVHATNAACTH